MAKIKFILNDGSEKVVDAENGLSLMEVARDNDLGIEGTCGGSISCCTCHIIVDKNWFEKVGFDPSNPTRRGRSLESFMKMRRKL